MKESIKRRAFSAPILSAISLSLFGVAIFSLPSIFTLQKDGLFILNIVCRAAAAIVAFVLANVYGFRTFSKPPITRSAILLLILGLSVCVNNFPVIGLFTGGVKIANGRDILKYLCYCAAIGISEESVFRGLVMPLVHFGLKDKRHSPLLTVAVSAGIFALCHLFNVFSAGVAATLFQVGYTFLTGCLFGTVYLFTKNIVFPILLHFIYDIGGLIFSAPFYIAVGNQWDTYTVIITAALGIFTAAVFTVCLWKYNAAE